MASYCFLAAFWVGCGVANAEDYCPPQPKAETEGEGARWYIPESAFTKEAANNALQELSAQVNKGVKGRDFLVENELRMIKGYLYRAYLAEHKKEFGTDDVFLRKEFCAFLRNDAFVSH
jgi:hypothetical protein